MILEQGITSFKVEKLVEVKDARSYEKRIIGWWYKKLGRARFMEIFMNRCLNPGILLDTETIERISTDPVRNTKIADAVAGNTNVRGKSWWNDGYKMKRSVDCPGEGWSRGALPHSAETKHKRSLSNKGKVRTKAQRQNYSKARCKPGHGGSHVGTKWVVDEFGDRRRV